MKKTVKLISVLLIILIVFSLTSCAGNGDVVSKSVKRLKVTEFSVPVYIVNDAIVTYLSTNPNITIGDAISNVDDEEIYDGDKPVTLSYTLTNANDKAESATFEYADNVSYKSSKSINLEADQNEVSLHNLVPNKDYVFRFTVKLTSGEEISESGSFSTVRTPRILSVEGLKNVRDLGGWRTRSGKMIKYGLIYRGSEFDGLVEEGYKATDAGLETLKTLMNIKFDCDLRDVKMDTEPGYLGSDVKREGYGCWAYGKALTTQHGKEVVRKVFTRLADESNYPCYIHCTYGRDRTGTICFLLEMMLGVLTEDGVRDFELTALSFKGLTRESGLMDMINELNNFSGSNYQEKCENYLLSIGVTKNQMDAIRKILLG